MMPECLKHLPLIGALVAVFMVTLITVTYWLKALLRPSPDGVAEAVSAAR